MTYMDEVCDIVRNTYRGADEEMDQIIDCAIKYETRIHLVWKDVEIERVKQEQVG